MGMPDYYEHYCPVKIVAGQLALSNMPFEMSRFGSSRALIVMDRETAAAGFAATIEQAFDASACQIGAWFCEVEGRADLNTARRIAAFFRSSGCDCLVAVGGGGCMDAAKAACLLAAARAEQLPAAEEVGGITSWPAKIYAVPVAYAPGYPVSSLAAVYDGQKGTTAYIASERLMPLLAVLDPRATRRTTARDRALYAMDALAKAVEAAVLPEMNPVVGIYGKAAVELIRKYLAPALHGDGRSKRFATVAGEAHRAMANAALYAGIAFSHGSAGLIAAAAHALHSITGVGAGAASAVLLPWGLDFYGRQTLPRILDLAGALAGSTRFLAEENRLSGVKASLVGLHQLTGLPQTLREAGVLRIHLEKIARTAASPACPYYRDGLFTEADVLALLEQAY